MSRKRPEEAEEGVDEWVVTYGDCMSLLLTFFILLFSFSTIDAQKWQDLVLSFRGGAPDVIGSGQYNNKNSVVNVFDEVSVQQMLEQMNEMDAQSGQIDATPTVAPTASMEATSTPEATFTTEPSATPGPSPDESTSGYYEFGVNNDVFLKLYNEIVAYKEQSDLGGGLGVYKTDTEIVLRFQNNLMFDSGKADINAASLEVLQAIIPMLQNYETDISKIRIEGHTDNVPINNSNFHDNYELSTARALSVVWYIKDNSTIPPEKLIAMGYGEYSPIATNDTEDGRALNRRTDIVLVANSD